MISTHFILNTGHPILLKLIENEEKYKKYTSLRLIKIKTYFTDFYPQIVSF